MSSNSFGKLFSVTTFGESHGPAIGCVIDGCPPGLAIAGGRICRRPRATRDRQVAAHLAAPRSRRGRDPVRRIRGPDHRHADRAADPQHRRAQQGLREDRRAVPPGPCRLHLLAEVRNPRPARRRPQFGARDHHARRRGGDRQEVAGRALRRSAFAAMSRRSPTSCRAASTGPPSRTIRSSGPMPARSASSRLSWMRCASPAIRSARASTWSRTACRPAGASRFTASSTPNWRRR